MKKPTIRVTKWLADIPVEARCSLCPDAIFRPAPIGHRPEKANYQHQLQDAFDRHVAEVHKNTK
jgi:hypothetical protein